MDKGEISYKKYRSGDDDGFYEIVREYFDGLCAYICGITGDRFLSEELADDTLLKLAVKKPDFNGRSSFRTWLYATGRNAAYDSLRKKRQPELQLDQADPAAESPEQAYIKGEREKQLYDALESLRPEYRDVLWLTFFEGMGAEEAAAVLKKNKGAFYTLLSRAKNSLKDTLIKKGFDYENV